MKFKLAWRQPNQIESSFRSEPVSWLVFKVYNTGGCWRASMYFNSWKDLGDYESADEAMQECTDKLEQMISEATELIFKGNK